MKKGRIGLYLAAFIMGIFLLSLRFVHHNNLSNPTIYEAEKGALKGTVIASEAKGFSGRGYVTGFKNAADSLRMTIQAPYQGLFDLAIGFRASNGNKNTQLFLNDQAMGEVSFMETTHFTKVPAGKVFLNKGANVIELRSGWGWYDIDYISLVDSSDLEIRQATKRLVNPAASVGAVELMSYLVDHYGKDILSGQQEYEDAQWLYERIGKWPAIVGFDFMNYSPSRVAHGTQSTETEKAIQWDQQGGIVTFAWHWNAPAGLVEDKWDSGFNTDSTAFDIGYAMSHPNSQEYRLLLRDIDAIANELLKLQKANVPVLFRPLHEAEGGWFWWGAKGPEPAKKLYRLLYDRLTHHHKLNNIIWVWNSVSPDWYPGNDVVDIVSTDVYAEAGDYGANSNRFESLVRLTQNQKLIALAENGPIPDPGQLALYHVDWSWFVTWTGEFLRDNVHNSLEHLHEVYYHPHVITLDQLPRFHHGDVP